MEILIQPVNRENNLESEGYFDGCSVDIGCLDVDVCVPDN